MATNSAGFGLNLRFSARLPDETVFQGAERVPANVRRRGTDQRPNAPIKIRWVFDIPKNVDRLTLVTPDSVPDVHVAELAELRELITTDNENLTRVVSAEDFAADLYSIRGRYADCIPLIFASQINVICCAE